MVKVLINGITGKMGLEVAYLVKQQPNMHLLGGLGRRITHNLPFPVYNDYNSIFELPNVIIDFSAPESTMQLLDFAVSKKIPLVIATTGFTDEQQNKILEASKKIAIFQSANISYEITMLKEMVASIAKKLPNAEIEIVETHHNRKIDSPSGTALEIAKAIQEATDNKYFYELNRLQKREKRNPNEIGFSSIRGGNIIGEHRVIFFNQDECFEIKHTAYSSNIFADGAIDAAKFILNQPVGYYNKLD